MGRILTPPLLTTLPQSCSMMIRFLLTMFLLHIAYENSHNSKLLLFGFIPLSNINMTFQSIPIRSLRTNSLATDLFHTCQETTALNQFHHGFNGLRTQHSFLGVTPQYNFISNGQKTQYPFIGPTTQYSFIGPTTPYHIICATTLSFVYGPVTLKQGNIETSVYCDLSEFKLVTPPITLLSSLFNCKNQCPGKTQQSILNLNKVNFFFCSNYYYLYVTISPLYKSSILAEIQEKINVLV